MIERIIIQIDPKNTRLPLGKLKKNMIQFLVEEGVLIKTLKWTGDLTIQFDVDGPEIENLKDYWEGLIQFKFGDIVSKEDLNMKKVS